jgi:nitrate/nitrite transporter NarK
MRAEQAAVPGQRSTEPRYGWVLVAGGLVSIGFQSAIFFSNALLLVAIPDESGWSRAATAAALSMLVLGSGAWAPVVGTLLQRWGPRRGMPAFALVQAAGFTAFSLARSPEELAAAMLLLVSPGSIGAGSLANYTAIQAWFRQRRGIALSLADSGASLGLILLVPLIQQLILTLGWRTACQALAAAALLLAPIHLLIQRPPPARESAGATHGEPAERPPGLLGLPRQRRLWLIGLGLAASRFAFQLVAIHQVVYLTEHGFDPARLASVFALTGLAGLAGRPGFGWLSDRLGIAPVYALLTACLLVAIGSLVAAGQSGQMLPLWLFALSFGAAMGVGTLLFARQVSDLVGSRSFGSVMGFGFAIGSLGGAAGGTSAALVHEATGTYLTSFAAAACMGLVSFGCIWAVDRSLHSPTMDDGQ